MARYRLLPTAEQAAVLAEHCRHARYVWNLAVEQQRHWQPGRRAPGYNEQCAQLTAARAEYDWLVAGSQTVQQQALRDFAQAMRNSFGGTHRRPTWRKAGVHEGFRQVGLKLHQVERLNGRFGRVWVSKVGWVRFRLSRPVPNGVKSYQVTCERAGRWHIAFAHVPDPIAKLKARERDRRKDWVEKASTDIARRFDTIRIEALDVRAMTRTARGTVEQSGVRVAQKRGLNRGISGSGRGLLAARLQHKAYGRVEQITAAYTSQRCSVCGHVAPGNRKSQAVFECEACTVGPCNADVNAACNIAAGRAVTARGDLGASRSANREPQHCSPAASVVGGVGIPRLQPGEDVNDLRYGPHSQPASEQRRRHD